MLHKFLLGLDPSFRPVISQILNMHPLLSIDNAFNMIIREECRSFIARGQDTRAEAVTFAAHVKEDKSSLLCAICHKSEHVSLDCF